MASGEAKYGALADKIARKYGVDPGLFRRLISAESGWNPNAVSGAGARGLTQVVPKWHPDANLSTPAGQLDAGARYLKNGIQKYGNPRDALSQYNSGRPWSQGKNISETRNYVTKILGGYQPGQGSGAGAGVAPPSTTPAPGAIQQVAGSLDARKLMSLLNNQRKRSLQGLMPTGNFQKNLESIVSAALPRAQVNASAQQIGAQVAGAGAAAGSAAGSTAGQLAVTAGKAIVAKAVPYSWGGGNTKGPTKGFGRGANTVGFDCSSFAQYIWAKAGVNIPRTTYGQIKAGKAVSNLAQAQPGDLLFPHTGHVQIYIGNGQVIEEPRTGGHAQVAKARSSYIAIRRPA